MAGLGGQTLGVEGHGKEGLLGREHVEPHLVPAAPVAHDGALHVEPGADAHAVGQGDTGRLAGVELHVLGHMALVVLEDVEDDHWPVLRRRRVRDLVEGRSVGGQLGFLDGSSGDHEGRRHAGILVLVELEVLGQLLHLQERPPGGVADHRDPVPLLVLSEELHLDVGQEHQLGADRAERAERRVPVVGLPSGQLGLPAVGVDGAVPVAHEVDHPDGTVLLGGDRRQASGELGVDGAVGDGGEVVGIHGRPHRVRAGGRWVRAGVVSTSVTIVRQQGIVRGNRARRGEEPG
jgi:hypothetical protein